MARKFLNRKAKKTIFSLEVIIVILVGAVVLLSMAMFVLYQQRESLSDQVSQLETLTNQQNQQVTDLQVKMRNAEITPSVTPMQY